MKLALSDKKIKSNFGRVYASDTLPELRKHHRYFIVNTDPSHCKGQHRQAIYFDNNEHCIFFCSYGAPPMHGIQKFISKNSTSLEWNDGMLQHAYTSTCGLFCLYFLWHICRGLSINRLQLTNSCQNEPIVQNFAQRYFKLANIPRPLNIQYYQTLDKNIKKRCKILNFRKRPAMEKFDYILCNCCSAGDYLYVHPALFNNIVDCVQKAILQHLDYSKKVVYFKILSNCEILQFIHKESNEDLFGYFQLHRRDPHERFQVSASNKTLFPHLLDCILTASENRSRRT
ncbi:uncharacterized protein NPIL_493691 [Nephila pilipes]|uniref:Uncharacterized protein n=1 Tax=Nephila pilipes TaxID=299642 RepID=A0A8X6Q368_NEPPI|nr:uncharacterized protein NPIL_493691 [Nephila pilipes]